MIIGKKHLLSSNTSSTCPCNMVNFGPLTAEIVSLVWGTPATQGVSRLGSVTARHSSSGRQPNFAAMNRGRHLYSAGRPSRWALAHVSSCCNCCVCTRHDASRSRYRLAVTDTRLISSASYAGASPIEIYTIDKILCCKVFVPGQTVTGAPGT